MSQSEKFQNPERPMNPFGESAKSMKSKSNGTAEEPVDDHDHQEIELTIGTILNDKMA